MLMRSLEFASMRSRLKLGIFFVSGLALLRTAQAEPLTIACGPGSGAFQLANSDTCLRFGGSVAAEFSGRAAAPNSFSLGASRPTGVQSAAPLTSSRIATRLSVDVRSQTEFGPVRAYVSLRRSRPPLR